MDNNATTPREDGECVLVFTGEDMVELQQHVTGMLLEAISANEAKAAWHARRFLSQLNKLREEI